MKTMQNDSLPEEAAQCTTIEPLITNKPILFYLSNTSNSVLLLA